MPSISAFGLLGTSCAPLWLMGVLLILSGCPEPSQPGLTTPEESGDQGVDMGQGVDDSLNNESELFAPARSRLVLTPIDWGLFLSDASPKAREIGLKPGGEVPLLLEPGVWTMHLCGSDHMDCVTFDGPLLQGVTTFARRELVEEREDSRAAHLFNVTDASFAVGLSVDGESMVFSRDPTSELTGFVDADPERIGQIFDDVIAQMHVESSKEAQIKALLSAMRRLAELDASPVQSSRGEFFIAPGEEGGVPPEVRGSFTNWESDEDTQLRHVAGALYGRFIEADDAEHLYKIVYAAPGQPGDWFMDLSNPHIEWDGFDPGAVGSFNSVLHQAPSTTRGRMMHWWQVGPEVIERRRDVYVYLPPGYDASEARRYPVLYIHDGNESIVRGRFHEVADARMSEEPSQAAILVFIGLPGQEERFDEYTFGTMNARGAAYASFIVHDLVPLVDERLRARQERAARGLLGASLGGLISYYIAMTSPEIFGYTAGMSSSFFWEDELIFSMLTDAGCQDIAYYLDSGEPRDNADVTRKMRDTLAAMGCAHQHWEEPGGLHEWSFWNARFDKVLETFARAHSE